MGPRSPRIMAGAVRVTENQESRPTRMRGMPRLCRICKGDQGSIMMPWSDGRNNPMRVVCGGLEGRKGQLGTQRTATIPSGLR
jgi:hypothetical protein